MSSNSIATLSMIVQEIISATSLSGSALVSHCFSSYQARREEAGREILFKRISETQVDICQAASEDEFIGVIYSYMLCANRGAAQVNLDLLAQAIAGEIKNGSIYPDIFNKYINILSSLTRDEILVIGTYIRCYKEVYAEEERKNQLFLGTVKPYTWSKLIDVLVPSCFPTKEYISVICGSLMRTGLTTAESPQLGNPPSHTFTILLDDISKLIDFEKAYKEFPDY